MTNQIGFYTKTFLGLAAGIVAAGLVSPVFAGEPTAVVEEVSGATSSVEILEFLEPGREIILTDGDTIIVGYLKSCRRETITGGSILIGDDRSTVSGGKMMAEVVECDGGKMNISAELAAKSAVSVFRGKESEINRPQLTLYSVTPLLVTPKAYTEFRIRRLDIPGPTVELPIVRGIADFARLKRPLRPGGIYDVRLEGRRVVVQIDPLAEPGGTIMSRLIRFSR